MRPEFEKMMTMAATKTDSDEPQIPSRVRRIPVRYMTKAGTADTRILSLVMPEHGKAPMPVVFTAHYGTPEDSNLLNSVLARGWCAAVSQNVTPAQNAVLTDDDLYYNSACIDILHHQPEINPDRIIVSGGSAGGYMTMMLSILHLGICASFSSSGIANHYFNMRCYESEIQIINLREAQKLKAEDSKDLMKIMDTLPMPLHFAVFATFGLNETHCEAYEGRRGFEPDFSPVFHAGCFSNPIMFTHNTSDILVPIDQLTRKYTYENGGTVPEGLSLRMADYELPKRVSRAMDEVLPPDEIFMVKIAAPQGKGEGVKIPFDSDKQYNMIILDDGAPEVYCGHSKNWESGEVDNYDYLEYQLALGVARTNRLSVDKLILMSERCVGRCFILPDFECEDKTVYGTPEMNRRMVMDELQRYFGGCDKEDAEELLKKAAEFRPELADALDEIRRCCVDL